MERELRGKEQQLADVTKKQSDLEMKLLRLNLNETETKSENDRLQKVCFHCCFFEHKYWIEFEFFNLGKSST